MSEKINLKVLLDHNMKGRKLIDIINENNIPIETACGGKGKCGKCKVKVLEGNISDITENEKKLLSKKEIYENVVLACERYALGDVTIEIVDVNEDTIEKGKIIKCDKNIDSIVQKIYLELPLPSLKDQRSDVKRILDCLKNKKNIDCKFDIKLISTLHEILLDSNYKVTVTILKDEIIRVQAGNRQDKNYGIGIDIGTTTVATYFVDLNSGEVLDTESSINSQKKYGADVISRINYAIESKENKEMLKSEIETTINKLIDKIISNNEIDKEDISIISIVGNTTMSHLLMGANVEGISKSPFNAVFLDEVIGNVELLNIDKLDKNTRFILLPNIGGYVGSDTLGAILSSDIKNKDGNILLIDIGTNCELALKTDKGILVCSTAAGPAFEGANMRYGMRASDGAIYDCDIDLEDDIYIKTIGDTSECTGICGSGYINLISKLAEEEIILPQGRITMPEDIEDDVSQKIKDRIYKQEKTYEIELYNDGNKKVSLMQQDIVNLQLAKAAVKTGIELLMIEGKVDKLDGILIAGAFGSNLNIDSIKSIDMIPNIKNENIKVLGNAAGSGAIQILLHKDKYNNMNEVIQNTRHVELANHKDFNRIFADSLML